MDGKHYVFKVHPLEDLSELTLNARYRLSPCLSLLVCFSFTHLGLGRHAVLLKTPTVFAKVCFVLLLENNFDKTFPGRLSLQRKLYNLGIISIKTSILLLYKRTFTENSVNRTFRFCFLIEIPAKWQQQRP